MPHGIKVKLVTDRPLPKPRKGRVLLVLLRQSAWVIVTPHQGAREDMGGSRTMIWIGEYGGARRVINPVEVSGWAFLEDYGTGTEG